MRSTVLTLSSAPVLSRALQVSGGLLGASVLVFVEYDHAGAALYHHPLLRMPLVLMGAIVIGRERAMQLDALPRHVGRGAFKLPSDEQHRPCVASHDSSLTSPPPLTPEQWRLRRKSPL